MQTSLHILAIVEELRRHAVGAEITGTEYYKKERILLFYFRKPGEKEKHALYFSFHPHHAGVALIPASKLDIQTSERPQALFTISSGTCTEVIYPSLDRIFALRSTTTQGERIFVVEAIGPNGSVWLCDAQFSILGSLRGRDFETGEKYQFSNKSERLDPQTVVPDQLATLLSGSSNPLRAMEKGLSGVSTVFARELLGRTLGDPSASLPFSDSQLDILAAHCRELSSKFIGSSTGYLYQTKSGSEPFPFRLTTLSDEPEKFKTFSLAIYASIGRKAESVREDNTERRTREIVDQSIAKLERLLRNLEADIAVAADFDRWREYGELLRIHHDKLRKGMQAITVEDSLHNTDAEITIPLDVARPVSDQAEIYFQKHRKGREGLDLLTRRREIATQELAEWNKIKESVEADPEAALQRYAGELQAAAKSKSVNSPQQSASVPRLPYREYTLSTGARIFVGRDGSDNDVTTFQHAKPFELWFHAQQCPGSHVILKFPNKSFVPSKSEIEEAASAAAFHSKARKNKLVPVIYAERRYVRKPRGAKPGLVVVEREKSVMVAPRDPGEK